MAAGNCVIVNGTPENREVVADAALVYAVNDPGHLRNLIQHVLDDEELVGHFRLKARRRVEQAFSWERVVDQYEALFARLVGPTP